MLSSSRSDTLVRIVTFEAAKSGLASEMLAGLEVEDVDRAVDETVVLLGSLVVFLLKLRLPPTFREDRRDARLAVAFSPVDFCSGLSGTGLEYSTLENTGAAVVR